tara:strand:+ start:893 stop:1090 length:198 start_codon:yes stop_codon:yes gene_type:complete
LFFYFDIFKNKIKTPLNQPAKLAGQNFSMNLFLAFGFFLLLLSDKRQCSAHVEKHQFLQIIMEKF